MKQTVCLDLLYDTEEAMNEAAEKLEAANYQVTKETLENGRFLLVVEEFV